MSPQSDGKLTGDELFIIMTISTYCVIDELLRSNIINKEVYLYYYDTMMNDYQKSILTNFEIFKKQYLKDITPEHN
jgi:hypothetical protein